MSIDLGALILSQGEHSSPFDGLCLMEAVSVVAGEPFSDVPECVSPVLGEFGRRLNDALPDDTRQRLVPLVPALVGTAGDGLDEQRCWLAFDWLARVWMPAWLRLVPELVGLADEAAAAGEVTDLVGAELFAPLAERAAGSARAARRAVGRNPGPGKWEATGDIATAAAQILPVGDVPVDLRYAANDAVQVAVAQRDRGLSPLAFLTPVVASVGTSAVDLFTRMVTGGAR